MISEANLKNAEWHLPPSMRALLSTLDGDKGMTRYVGGAVRDTLLGLPVKDIDLATKLLPDDVLARLEKNSIKAIPTGIDHGTITAIVDGTPVEITTLRRDVSTDGRRATIAFSKEWKEDAARRDFTINALSVDPISFEIHDYFAGLEDLETRHIRFIGSAAQRIAEDHLRIMRYFRFLARFGQDKVDDSAFAACSDAAASLKSLSRERIADELLKLLATDNPEFAISQMIRADIFTHIVSDIDANANSLLAKVIQRERAHGIEPSAIRRLVALLPKNAKTVDKIVTSLRFSKKMRRAVVDRLQAQNPEPKDVRALAYHHDIETTQDIILLFAADNVVEDCLIELSDWAKPVFPITGGQLIKMGLVPGPIVAETLAKVERDWIEEGFPGETRVRELAAQRVANQT